MKGKWNGTNSVSLLVNLSVIISAANQMYTRTERLSTDQIVCLSCHRSKMDRERRWLANDSIIRNVSMVLTPCIYLVGLWDHSVSGTSAYNRFILRMKPPLIGPFCAWKPHLVTMTIENWSVLTRLCQYSLTTQQTCVSRNRMYM